MATKNKKSVVQLIKELDEVLTEKNDTYMQYHNAFDTYRGKALSDHDTIEVNNLIRQIQDVFAQLNIACNFIAHRYEWSNNINQTHAYFIKELIDVGAQPSGEKIKGDT